MTPEQHDAMANVRPFRAPRGKRANGSDAGDGAPPPLPPASDPEEVTAAASTPAGLRAGRGPNNDGYGYAGDGVSGRTGDPDDYMTTPEPPARLEGETAPDAGDELPPGAVGPAVERPQAPRMMARAVHAPVRVTVILTCPSCGAAAATEATLSARVVKDSDGTGSLTLRTRAAKAGHICGQGELGLAEGPRSR